jgi:C-terminal processing protease CtpA/Prc
MEKQLVKYELRKKGPGHDAFYDPDPWSLSPGVSTYTAPVILLTNRSCFSACNDFALYMSQRPNTRLMGDQTGGGGGVPQDFLLPNGWILQYTSTVTLSAAKLPIEAGIQPTENIGITSVEELSGKDPILEKAFNALQ